LKLPGDGQAFEASSMIKLSVETNAATIIKLILVAYLLLRV